MSELDDYTHVARLSQLKLNAPTPFASNHLSVLLTKLGDAEVVAYAPTCPHQMANLRSGNVDGDGIDCPLHFYRFNLRTGACEYPRGEQLKLKTYSVKLIDGEDIWVKIDKPKWMED